MSDRQRVIQAQNSQTACRVYLPGKNALLKEMDLLISCLPVAFFLLQTSGLIIFICGAGRLIPNQITFSFSTAGYSISLLRLRIQLKVATTGLKSGRFGLPESARRRR